MAKETKGKYEYCQISIPREIKEEAEKVMNVIGCRTMTAFATLALKEYMDKIQTQSKQN